MPDGGCPIVKMSAEDVLWVEAGGAGPHPIAGHEKCPPLAHTLRDVSYRE
jgi:hypothetical protein